MEWWEWTYFHVLIPKSQSDRGNLNWLGLRRAERNFEGVWSFWWDAARVFRNHLSLEQAWRSESTQSRVPHKEEGSICWEWARWVVHNRLGKPPERALSPACPGASEQSEPIPRPAPRGASRPELPDWPDCGRSPVTRGQRTGSRVPVQAWMRLWSTGSSSVSMGR